MNVNLRLSKFANSKRALYILCLPVLFLLGSFIFYPFVRGLLISFTNWDGLSQTYKIVGGDQYVRMFTDRNIKHVVINTFVYAFGSTIFQNLFGLCFALLLDRKIRGKNVARAVIYLPILVSGLIMGYIWYFLFKLGGSVNEVIVLLGKAPINFLSLGDPTVYLITAVNVFQYAGLCMIIYLAGLQTITRDYYEAASIDGAGGFAMLRKITLPLLMPSITINVVLNLIGGMKLFDVIIAMTNGGPGYTTQSLSTMMYQLYFASYDAGYAAALGNFMFVLITIIGITTLIMLRKREVEY